MLYDIFNYFSNKISLILKEKVTRENINKLEEIRLRSNQNIILKFNYKEEIVNYIVTSNDILETLQNICENSIYSYQKEICQGYITIKNGHRVGITGNCVIENGKIININYISSLNFRIAKQIIGCSNEILKYIVNSENNTIFNTLIVSLPGAGKTTLLRDIIRNISNGINTIGFKGKTVGIVDERGEIAAMYKGVPQNDIGIRSDVIDNMPRPNAIKILVRSMAPDVIACDEIGSLEDIQAIDYAMCSGVKGIFTAHGKNLEEINKNSTISTLLNKNIFERIILLNSKKKGETECIYL